MDDKTRRDVIHAYQHGRNSIQDIARIFKVEVSEVLEAIGEGGAKKVVMPGDLISESEAGPNAKMNYGKEVSVPYTSD